MSDCRKGIQIFLLNNVKKRQIVENVESMTVLIDYTFLSLGSTFCISRYFLLYTA